MKKKFLPAYKPARLVLGRSRTYINVYYTDKEGKHQHKKPTFELGHILNKELRKSRGEDLVEKINWWLRNGFHFEDFEEHQVPASFREQSALEIKAKETNLIEAIHIARDMKIMQTKKQSMKVGIRSDAKLLVEYLKKEKMGRRTIGSFSKRDAQGYLIDYLSQGVKHITYNEKINKLRKLFAPLVENGYVEKNPFSGLRKLTEEEKNRRPFEPNEAKLVQDYLYEHNRLLFYAIIIQLGCFVRPDALRKLKFQDLLLDEGLIRVRGDHVKTSKSKYPTIPDELMPFFQEDFFRTYPGHFYIFGYRGIPNADKHIGKNTLGRWHRKILDQLHEEGKLLHREGLEYYSWKDTGITETIEQVGLVFASEQADHSHINTTLRYRKKKRVIEKMKGVKLLQR